MLHNLPPGKWAPIAIRREAPGGVEWHMLNRLPPDPPEIPPGETAKTRMAVLRAYGETRQSYLDEALMPIREIRAAYDEGYVELAQQRQGKEFVLMAYRRKERDRRRRPFFAARDTD